MLDEMGLAVAVRWYAQGFEKRSGIKVCIEAPSLPRLPSDIEMTLFRIVREGLANIHRHSGSREATIAFEYHREGIELEIADKGKGMPNSILGDASGSLGVGIPGMRVRVQQLNGTLEFESSSDGTTLRVAMPVGSTTHSASAVV
jgi:signal transduction histidine kinase